MRKLMTMVIVTVLIGIGYYVVDGSFLKEREAIDLVKKDLENPETAEFISLVYYRGSNSVCGSVKAINSQGRQTDFNKFAVNLSSQEAYYEPKFAHTPRPSSPTLTGTTIQGLMYDNQRLVNYAMQAAEYSSKMERETEALKAWNLVSEKLCKVSVD